MLYSCTHTATVGSVKRLRSRAFPLSCISCPVFSSAFPLQGQVRRQLRPRIRSRLACLARCLASLFLPLFLLDPDWRFLVLPATSLPVVVVVASIVCVVVAVVPIVLVTPRCSPGRRERDLLESTTVDPPSHTPPCARRIALIARLSSLDLRLYGRIRSTARRSPRLRPMARKLSWSEVPGDGPSTCWVCSRLAQSQFAPFSMYSGDLRS